MTMTPEERREYNKRYFAKLKADPERYAIYKRQHAAAQNLYYHMVCKQDPEKMAHLKEQNQAKWQRLKADPMRYAIHRERQKIRQKEYRRRKKEALKNKSLLEILFG